MPAEIAQWWSNHVISEPKLGALTEVRFENGNVFKLEIIDLEIGKRVYWQVRLSPHDWEGSTITWDIMPTAEGTNLRFGRHNLTVGPTAYSIEDTRTGWEYFLNSLKRYLETGQGTPYSF